MFTAASVCLSVCQHDNFRTIKHRMTKLGSYVHCTKISPKVRMSRSKVTITGDKKNEKCGILFRSCPLGRGPHASTAVGISAHAV